MPASGSVGTFRSGKNGRVKINGTTVYLQEWSVQDQAEDHDTTCFDSTGTEGVTSWTDATVTIKGQWNASQNPFDSPPAIYPGNVLTNVLLYENVTDDTYWSFPFMRVISATNGAPVRGMITFEAQLKNQGVYTRPTGNV